MVAMATDLGAPAPIVAHAADWLMGLPVLVTPLAAEAALHLAGFTSAALHRPATFAGRVPDVDRPGNRKVRVVEAWT